METKQKDEMTLQDILLDLRKTTKIRNVAGGSSYYSGIGGMGGSSPWGWHSDTNPINLQGIVVTAHGGCPDYGTSNSWSWTDSNSIFHPDYSQGVGGSGYQTGGDSGGTRDDLVHSYGTTAVNNLCATISDNSAVWVSQLQNTNAFHLANAVSVAGSIPNLQLDLINMIKGDAGIVTALGESLMKGNAILGSSVAIIGCMDGDVTTSDELASMSALIGTLGLYSVGVPWFSLACDGISFVLGAASTYYANQENSNKHY